MKLDRLVGLDLDGLLAEIYILSNNHPSFNMRQLPKLISHLITHGRTKMNLNRVGANVSRLKNLDLNAEEFILDRERISQMIKLMEDNRGLWMNYEDR